MALAPDNSMSLEKKREMRSVHYQSCPGKCLGVPYVEIPTTIVMTWLKFSSYLSWPKSQQIYAGDLLVSCSLTLGMM